MSEPNESEPSAEALAKGLKILHASGIVEVPLGADELVIQDIYRAMRAVEIARDGPKAELCRG